MSHEALTDPQPGSPEAIAQGCTCPPQLAPDFACDPNCPLHGSEDRVEPEPHSQIVPDRHEA